jgi:putative membrane protein
MKNLSHSRNRKLISLWLFIFFLVLIWSGIRPYDIFVWFLEVLPALCGLLILTFTYRYFRFTELAYWLMLIHAIILMIGGHYTYAEVPLFNWLRDTFELSRNHYDKVGHFAQGFIPAIVAREILIRKSPVKTGSWLFFMVVCICLSISAFYEFIEWWVAVATGTAADAFLGTQGYVWDTQSDMFIALIGAVTSLVFLGRFHDNCIASELK